MDWNALISKRTAGNPDALLLQMIATLREIGARYATLSSGGSKFTDHTALECMKALAQRSEELQTRISDTAATTPEGALAKLEVAFGMYEENHHPYGMRLHVSAVRDALRVLS